MRNAARDGRIAGNSPGGRLTISISGCERTHTVSSLIAGKKKAGTNPAGAFTRYVCICLIVPVAAERMTPSSVTGGLNVIYRALPQ